ncbi:hypothetical protein ACFQQB_52500 [Nonomuraea rubra]|uniref:hypothetical protein n=1 Tax=Nonomuraea rubra TaxID=46180 RepID=UPI00360B93E9
MHNALGVTSCDRIDEGAMGFLALLPLMPMHARKTDQILAAMQTAVNRHTTALMVEWNLVGKHLANGVIQIFFERGAPDAPTARTSSATTATACCAGTAAPSTVPTSITPPPTSGPRPAPPASACCTGSRRRSTRTASSRPAATAPDPAPSETHVSSATRTAGGCARRRRADAHIALIQEDTCVRHQRPSGGRARPARTGVTV